MVMNKKKLFPAAFLYLNLMGSFIYVIPANEMYKQKLVVHNRKLTVKYH